MGCRLPVFSFEVSANGCRNWKSGLNFNLNLNLILILNLNLIP